jgi:ATP-dependent HslUV protease subunit HslV
MMIKSTTIIALRSIVEKRAVIACDGQATMDNIVIKSGTKKVHRLYDGTIITGFAGATADCLTLLDRLEKHLQSYDGQLRRAAVELSKEWRTDRNLRHLEAIILCAGKEGLLMVSGSGDVLEADDNIFGIGSGGVYAVAAARGICSVAELPIADIARKSLEIAGKIDIYTNTNIIMEEIAW